MLFITFDLSIRQIQYNDSNKQYQKEEQNQQPQSLKQEKTLQQPPFDQPQQTSNQQLQTLSTVNTESSQQNSPNKKNINYNIENSNRYQPFLTIEKCGSTTDPLYVKLHYNDRSWHKFLLQNELLCDQNFNHPALFFIAIKKKYDNRDKFHDNSDYHDAYIYRSLTFHMQKFFAKVIEPKENLSAEEIIAYYGLETVREFIFLKVLMLDELEVYLSMQEQTLSISHYKFFNIFHALLPHTINNLTRDIKKAKQTIEYNVRLNSHIFDDCQKIIEYKFFYFCYYDIENKQIYFIINMKPGLKDDRHVMDLFIEGICLSSADKNYFTIHYFEKYLNFTLIKKYTLAQQCIKIIHTDCSNIATNFYNYSNAHLMHQRSLQILFGECLFYDNRAILQSLKTQLKEKENYHVPFFHNYQNSINKMENITMNSNYESQFDNTLNDIIYLNQSPRRKERMKIFLNQFTVKDFFDEQKNIQLYYDIEELSPDIYQNINNFLNFIRGD